ncbi:hypothetical protein, partial [Methanoregula sp.]|uniref:hypothetical protein n=1 Tax=Methanoregula sp. TaxID=2052170 RepID=UPI0025FC6336
MIVIIYHQDQSPPFQKPQLCASPKGGEGVSLKTAIEDSLIPFSSRHLNEHVKGKRELICHCK